MKKSNKWIFGLIAILIVAGIVIYFGLYEIAPYYVGIPKFKLKFDEFNKYLNYT